jgi:lysophospholipase L1-like esterase
MWRAARRLGLAPAPVPEAVPVPELRTTPQGFSRALEALVDWALAIGARPALVTMPPQAPFAAEAVTVRRPYYDEYNRRIAALGLERDVASAKVGAAGQPIHEADGLHLNGAGQRWLAEVVFEQLDAQGFWRAIGAEAA